MDREKLRHNRQLMLDLRAKGYSVGEIASALGYKDPSVVGDAYREALSAMSTDPDEARKLQIRALELASRALYDSPVESMADAERLAKGVCALGERAGKLIHDLEQGGKQRIHIGVEGMSDDDLDAREAALMAAMSADRGK